LQAPAPGVVIAPIGIDQSGSVFGWAGNQLGVWGLDGSLTSLLPDPGVGLRRSGFFGYPTAQRNDLGQVVAITAVGGIVLYDPGTSTWTDITPSIENLDGGIFSTIQDFNNRGQFVGLVTPPRRPGWYGYVVSPVPEPSSLALAMIGIGGVGGLSLLRIRFGKARRAPAATGGADTARSPRGQAGA
jgi:hypothetical protein